MTPRGAAGTALLTVGIVGVTVLTLGKVDWRGPQDLGIARAEVSGHMFTAWDTGARNDVRLRLEDGLEVTMVTGTALSPYAPGMQVCVHLSSGWRRGSLSARPVAAGRCAVTAAGN